MLEPTPELGHLLRLTQVTDQIPEFMQLSHIFPDSLSMLQAINQFAMLFSLEINWEAVVKQF